VEIVCTLVAKKKLSWWSKLSRQICGGISGKNFDCRWRNLEVEVKKFGDGRRNFKVKKR